MKKLIICEGKTDGLFLTELLKNQFQINAAQIGFLADKFNDGPKESIIVLHCGGLNGIEKFLEDLEKRPLENEFRKVPTLIIWDEDPNNGQSLGTKERIEKKIDVINTYSPPFVISGMLEELIIGYLRKQIKENKPTGYNNEVLLKESIHCMDSYLKCLQAKDSHSKIRLDLLEKGILLKNTEKYDSSRQNLDDEDKIFKNIDFKNDTFKSLVTTIENFIKAN